MSAFAVGMSRNMLTYAGAHRHTSYEVILNREGTGSITIGDRTEPFFPGSIHVIPPDTPHIKESKDGFRDIFLRTEMLYPNTVQTTQHNGLSLSDDSQKTMDTMLELLVFRYCLHNENDSVLLAMYDLTLRLLDEFCVKTVYDPVVESLIRRLMLSFHDPEFSATAILHESGYHIDHIRRLFIAATGKTPGAYLKELRINHAKRLLLERKNSHLSIADIGLLCGYYDAKYFSRVFKSVTGVSPADYGNN